MEELRMGTDGQKNWNHNITKEAMCEDIHEEYVHIHEEVHEHSHEEVHKHPHEVVSAHSHEETHSSHHSHGHHHSPEEKKKQLNRLSKIIGHLQHVKKMIENDEDCSDVLMQLAASKSALNGLGKAIINEHLEHCICHAIEDGDMEAVEEFQKAIQRYI